MSDDEQDPAETKHPHDKSCPYCHGTGSYRVKMIQGGIKEFVCNCRHYTKLYHKVRHATNEEDERHRQKVPKDWLPQSK